MTEEINTYLPTLGSTAVNLEETETGKVYDYFQSIKGKNFLLLGDRGFLEFIPVQDAGNPITRYGRQLILLFKHAIKAPARPFFNRERFTLGKPTDTCGSKTDFFCGKQAKDQVIWEGKYIKILYPNRPITKQHFLFATKQHRDSFKDMSKAEFTEVIDLAKRVGALFTGKKYLLCKIGYDAGQTEPHFHLHLIVTESKLEGACGRLRIVANILLNMIPFLSTHLEGEALMEKVNASRGELQCLNS